MRRRFYELVAAGPKPIASETLKRIAALYANEKVIGRCALMRVRRCGRINTHRSLTFSNRGCAKTDAGQPEERPQAIRYALSRRNGLTLFVDDGRVEIDSYVVERAILPIALNCKNALVAGADAGAENSAIVASLVDTRCESARGLDADRRVDLLISQKPEGSLCRTE